MLSDIFETIMIRAIQYRLDKGEKIEDIMASYPKLTDEEKKEILAKVTIN